MGTASTNSTSLRQLLRSLCNDTQWNYAIYWKLKHWTRMLLTWEDGYCDYHQPRDSEQHLLESFCFNDTSRSISFDHEIDTHDGSSEAYSIGLAVANMSCLTYALGEGAVGKVALTGKHSWVCSHEFNSKLVPKYPDEWHLQFAFGVKTILLVPVVPHGVVQLGSIELEVFRFNERLTLGAAEEKPCDSGVQVEGEPTVVISDDFLETKSQVEYHGAVTVGQSSDDNPIERDYGIDDGHNNLLDRATHHEELVKGDDIEM